MDNEVKSRCRIYLPILSNGVNIVERIRRTRNVAIDPIDDSLFLYQVVIHLLVSERGSKCQRRQTCIQGNNRREWPQ